MESQAAAAPAHAGPREAPAALGPAAWWLVGSAVPSPRSATWVLALSGVVLGLAAFLRRYLLRRRGEVATALQLQLFRDEVPSDYRAAGVLFFVRGAKGAVARVLLGVESRKVRLKELGTGGSGTAELRVVVFPQGKREPADQGFVDTAEREFVEETGDEAGLARHLAAVRADPPAAWFPQAKMAVVFCEVPRAAADGALSADPGPPQARGAGNLPLQPVWVQAEELRRVLADSSRSAELRTRLGDFPVFPMTRRFLEQGRVLQWLGA